MPVKDSVIPITASKLGKMVLPASILILILAGYFSCGKDTIIDVNTLPCGTARGNSASGNFQFSGLVASDGCEKEIGDYKPYLILTEDERITVNHYEPGNEGCPIGRLEFFFPQTDITTEFTLKGGLWSDGTFRIGQAITGKQGQVFRLLFDGKFHPIEEGKPRQDHFSGVGRIDVTIGDKECTYKLEYSGNRVSD